jgi:hypothetical protein
MHPHSFWRLPMLRRAQLTRRRENRHRESPPSGLFSGNRLPLAKALVRHPAQAHAEIMRMLKRVSLAGGLHLNRRYSQFVPSSSSTICCEKIGANQRLTVYTPAVYHPKMEILVH